MLKEERGINGIVWQGKLAQFRFWAKNHKLSPPQFYFRVWRIQVAPPARPYVTSPA
jgi:hypothetical protein